MGQRTIVTQIITKLTSLGIFLGNGPVKKYRTNIGGLFMWQFVAGFCSRNFGPSVLGLLSGRAFSGMGPINYQINLLGILSGNDPVKDGRK